MLLLLVQGKLSNLTVEERFAFNVSPRMFTRSIVIQRRVKDLQLGVESYQKRLNLTKPDTYRSDLKRREAYTAYSNPRGFIYQNRLMRIDELHKFSDGTLNDVRNALDNHAQDKEDYEKLGTRRRDDDDDDKDEGPFAGSDQGSKRQKEGKEPESTSAPLETATRSTSRSTTGSKSRQASASESAFAEEPGFAAALAILIIGASQSKLYGKSEPKLENKLSALDCFCEIVEGERGITQWFKGLERTCDEAGSFGGKNG
nr:hypothetical protein [Tanacetum cinerariifolium]